MVTDWSVDPDDWGTFLCAVWDFWFSRDYGKIHVDLFETAIAQSLGLPSQRCITAELCGKGPPMEHYGDVYSCDHFVYPEYRVGNIKDIHWGECPENRLIRTPSGDPGLNYLCHGMKMFYSNIQDDMQKILRRVKSLSGLPPWPA